MPPRSTNEYFCRHTKVVDDSAASDSNDGRDPGGYALTNARYDNADDLLTENGSGSFGSAQAGDLIYLDGGSGVTIGLYTIASVISPTQVTLVEKANGGGVGLNITSSNGPKLTPNNLASTVFNGSNEDLIANICADATYVQTSSIDIVASASLPSKANILRGVQSRGVWDGTTKPVLDNDVGGFRGCISVFGANNYAHISDIEIQSQASRRGILYSPSSSLSGIVTTMRVHISGGSNCFFEHTSGQLQLVLLDCRAVEGTGSGLFAFSGGDDTVVTMVRCVGHGATSDDGIRANNVGTITALSCLLYNNLHGMRLFSGTANLQNCVFDRNTNDGVLFTANTIGGNMVFDNCAFTNNGSYGVKRESISTNNAFAQMRNCLFWQNTTGSTNHTVQEDLFGTNIYADPQFTSIVDGSENYTPLATSPLVAAGFGAPTA